jgi:hypothetical protein
MEPLVNREIAILRYEGITFVSSACQSDFFRPREISRSVKVIFLHVAKFIFPFLKTFANRTKF